MRALAIAAAIALSGCVVSTPHSLVGNYRPRGPQVPKADVRSAPGTLDHIDWFTGGGVRMAMATGPFFHAGFAGGAAAPASMRIVDSALTTKSQQLGLIRHVTYSAEIDLQTPAGAHRLRAETTLQIGPSDPPLQQVTAVVEATVAELVEQANAFLVTPRSPENITPPAPSPTPRPPG